MQVIKNDDFLGVAATGKAVLALAIGYTYHGILLKLGGTALTKAMLTRIALKINRKVVYEITGARLDKMNDYKGGASNAAYLLIDFTEHQAKDILSEMAGVIGTAGGVTEAVLEVTITGATAPTLESWAIVSGPQALSKNIHTLVSGTLPCTGAGTFSLPLPVAKDGSRAVKRVWLFSTLATAIIAKKNGMEIHNTERAVNEFLQQHYEGDPDASFYCVDYTLANNTLPEVVTTADANSHSLKVTVSGAETIEYYIEALADLNDLAAG